MSALYFAYGSNMSTARLRERVPAVQPVGRAQLMGYRLSWNKPGRDGSGKANIIAAPAESVWGVLYEFPSADWTTLDSIEVDYTRETHSVFDRHGKATATELYRWLCEPDAPERPPHDWYRAHLLAGAREHDLPEEVIKALSRPVSGLSGVFSQSPDPIPS